MVIRNQLVKPVHSNVDVECTNGFHINRESMLLKFVCISTVSCYNFIADVHVPCRRRNCVMAPIQQDQQFNKPKKQRQKELFPLLLRYIIPSILIIAIGATTILWILSSKANLPTIFPIIF